MEVRLTEMGMAYAFVPINFRVMPTSSHQIRSKPLIAPVYSQAAIQKPAPFWTILDASLHPYFRNEEEIEEIRNAKKVGQARPETGPKGDNESSRS